MSGRRPTALPPAGPPPAGASARQIGPTRLPSPGAVASPPASPVVPAAKPGAMPAPAPAPRAPAAPTRLQGVARAGLEVPAAALQQRFPGLDADEAERVQRILRGTVPDVLGLREAADWGTGAQHRYGELVERALQLAQDPRRIAAQQHLRRLHAVLDEVAEAIEEQLAPGLLSRWRAGPWELLARHRAEIDQLRSALGGAWQALADQRDTLERLRLELRALTGELQAWGLAATWLADTLPRTDDLRVASTLVRRAGELTALHGHILQAQALHAQADADLDTLCGAIQQAVLSLLPAWLEKALHAGRAGTPTAARELERELHGLLRMLPAVPS